MHFSNIILELKNATSYVYKFILASRGNLSVWSALKVNLVLVMYTEKKGGTTWTRHVEIVSYLYVHFS